MRSGQLKRRIAITAPSETQDQSGQPGAGPDTTVLSCRAAITVASSKEIYALGAGFTAQVTHKVTVRFPSVSLAQGMTVLYRDRRFLVQLVSDPDENRRELNLMCLEQPK
jgi:SPP1 family predicted phage head-tail adaptor